MRVDILIYYIKFLILYTSGSPIETLTFCDDQPDNGLEELYSQIPGLSAVKRMQSQQYSESDANKLLRFSGPFSDDMPLPWSCHMEPYWRDLGSNYFPRFIKDGICVNTTCWYGHYQCQPVKYRVNVIRQQDHECIDRNFPGLLSLQWRRRTVDVTSNCVCKRV